MAVAKADALLSRVKLPERTPLRLASAAAMVVAALCLNQVLGLGLDRVPRYATFYPAVVVAALLLGFVPGLVATALSAFAVYLWVFVPRGVWKVPARPDLESLAIFIVAGLFVCEVVRVLHFSRRRAEHEKSVAVTAAVQETQNRLRLAIQAAEAGTWEWDLRTGENTWSPELWSLYGLEPRSCNPSYEAWRSSILPEDRAEAEKAVAEAVRQGSAFDLSWRVRDRDGRERWLLSKGWPERGAGGEVVKYLGVVLDMTERRRSENALRQSRTTLKAALAAMTEAVFIADGTGRFIEFNDAFVAFHRFANREEATKTLAETRVFVEVLAADGTPAPLDRRPVSRALGGETGMNVEFTLRRTDTGETWEGSYSFAPIRLGSAIVGAVVVGRDVTEQKRAHERLEAERERLAVTLRSIGDAVIATDEKARITILNQAAEGLTGWKLDEALGKPIREVFRIVSEDTGHPVEDPTDRLLWEGGVVGHADRTALLARDGTRRPIVNKGAPIRDSSGRIRGAVLVFRDQSEERRAERALRESEARYRVIFEQAAAGVQQIDSRSGRFLQVNAKFCDMLGYSRDEVMAATWQDFTHPDDLQANLDQSRRVDATGEPARFEKRYVRKDGAIVWASLTVSPLFMPGEEPTTRVAIVEDITERKRVDEAMRRSEERFRALIERSSDLIQVLDAGGCFQFWSQSSVDDLGWTSEEMLGRPALALVHETDRGRIGEILGPLLSSPGAIARDSFRYEHKDGSWRSVETLARNLLDDPAVQGVVLNSRDVTEQRLLEEQLRQAQKLESVGRLAGGVAHDFNNLLTVILGCSEMLREKRGPQTAEDVENVEQIHAAGERARDLTRQLLAFARKQVITPVPLDLNSLLRSNQRMLSRLLGEDVDLVVNLSPSPWSMYADPSQVEQVILNLVVNARDAMPRGGRLLIETRNGPASLHEANSAEGLPVGDWVQLLVSDDGVGMTREVQAHVFEPFFTTKEQGKGTGLGLATVYGIVSQAGGHIHIESEPTRGTTFTVCFRRADRAPAPSPSAAAPTSTPGTEAILVVEDDSMVRAVVVRALEAEGYEVSAVGHPHRALELGQEKLGRLQLLVTDVVMPEMDGRALADELSLRCPGLKVLYLSGYAGDAISERGVLASGLEFLAKPFARASLLAKVRAILDAR